MFREPKDILQEEIMTNNDERIVESKHYLSSLNQSSFGTNLREVPDSVYIALTVVTVSRNRHQTDNYKPQYLTQVMARILRLLENSESNGLYHKVKVTVCNVDPDVRSYWEAQELMKLVEVVNRFSTLSLPLIDLVEKEKQDYVFCLNTSLSFDPDYVLLIEDDALPHDDFFVILERMLHDYIEHKSQRGESILNKEDITYVKLYHPDKILGYFDGELEYRLPELLSIGLLVGSLLTGIYRMVCCIQRQLPVKSVLKLWVIFSMYTICICVTVGRQHMILELRHALGSYGYVLTSAPECCTPAMLFPKAGAQRVVNLLHPIKCHLRFGKDLALEQLRRQHHLKAYLLQPNLVSHIGMFSLLSHNLVDSFVL